MGRLAGVPRFEIQTCASLLAELGSGAQAAVFSIEERARAQSIASATRRNQFLAGRCLAKRMLGEALGGSPADWHICADATRKPQVLGHTVELSIAHSGPVVACCIADEPVGVDVERMGRARPVADMAVLVCSAAEQHALQAYQAEAAQALFMQWWTCKEARLKQLGLPFGLAELRAIQTAPVESACAEVLTWCFAQPGVVVSLVASALADVKPHWPGDWQLRTTLWHRYT